MSIQIIDNFELSLAKPIDNRFVVGSLSFYTNKDSIPLKYNGLRIYDTTDSTPYIWTGATWSYDIDRVSITLDNNTNSSHYITFVGATSGVNYVKTSDKGLKYNPLSSQVLLADGSVSLPTLSFSSSTNLGIYRVNSTTLGFASGGAKRFEISSTSATSSVPFNVSAISASGSPALRVSSNLINTTSYSNGAMSIGRVPSIGFPGTNFEFFPQNRNSYFYIATLAPLPIASSSGSSLTIEGSRISIYNARDNSGYTVRDAHYFNTETYEGFISMGNVGDNDQFQFHMNGRTAILGGGGLYIGNNLSVGGESSIGNSLTVGGALNVSGETFIDNKITVSESLNVSGTASIMDNVSIGASSNTSIFSGSSLFNSSTPKLEVLVGNSISNYQELMVLRGLKGSATNNLTRVGVIMKLSDDLDSNESNKMGGMILESTTQYSNSPSLYLVTANQKRLGIDNSGNIYATNSTASAALSSVSGNKVVISLNDIYADIHNKGTDGIGDSGNNATPWSYPSIASGQLTLIAGDVTSPSTNCSSFTVKPCAWHRTGNTVTVSGQISFTISTSGVDSTFKLKIPIPSSFGVDSGGGNGNNWQLNGLGKIVGGAGTNSGNIATIQAYGTSTAQFKFYPSMTGAVTMVYHYTYTIGTWLSTSGGGGGLGLGL